jgi:hypothetical protein
VRCPVYRDLDASCRQFVRFGLGGADAIVYREGMAARRNLSIRALLLGLPR